jgi:hypothetical protein
MSTDFQCPVAVLFLVFNRPHLADITFERIRAARPPRLYVHCDGARESREGERDLVLESHKIIEKVDWPCEVFTLFRPENIGLRDALYGAISWFFEQEASGIIMEDDCLVDDTFFRFCSELLEQYADDSHVMHIGAWNIIEKDSQLLPSDYFWTKFSIVTAFATWRRAWSLMDKSMRELERYEKDGLIKDFLPSFLAQAYMLDKFKTTKEQRNRSWAYSWFYSILINNGLCLLSSKNLVQNIGFGDNASNTNYRNAAAEIETKPMQFPLKHPDSPTIYPNLEKKLFAAYQKKTLRLWLWYLLHLLKLR